MSNIYTSASQADIDELKTEIVDLDTSKASASAFKSLKHKFDELDIRVDALETKINQYDELLAKLHEGMEAAKENPMVANMMRMVGIEL